MKNYKDMLIIDESYVVDKTKHPKTGKTLHFVRKKEGKNAIGGKFVYKDLAVSFRDELVARIKRKKELKAAEAKENRNGYTPGAMSESSADRLLWKARKKTIGHSVN